MSGEREAAESSMLPSLSASPVGAVAGSESPESPALDLGDDMGDVLTKEQKLDEEEEDEDDPGCDSVTSSLTSQLSASTASSTGGGAGGGGSSSTNSSGLDEHQQLEPAPPPPSPPPSPAQSPIPSLLPSQQPQPFLLDEATSQTLLLEEGVEVKIDDIAVEEALDNRTNIEINRSIIENICNPAVITKLSRVQTHDNVTSNDVMCDENYQCPKAPCLGRSSNCADDDPCDCTNCSWNERDLSREEFQEMVKCKQLGVNLRNYIRSVFHWFIENSEFYAYPPPPPLSRQPQDLHSIGNIIELRESVVFLCEKVPYQLTMWLVGQVQELVIGVKLQLLGLLYNCSVDNLAEAFISKLLDGYEALLATAVHISDLLEPLQNELFSKVNLTWQYVNKNLYQNYLFSYPLVQNNLPVFLGQLKECMRKDNSKYKCLLQRYFAFYDDITKNGSLCPEIVRLIDKYNAEQVADSDIEKVREDFERFISWLKTNDLPVFNDQLQTTDQLPKSEFLKKAEDGNTVQNEDDFFFTTSYFQGSLLPQPFEIQIMFNDWRKSPQQRLADLVEALTLTEEDKECKEFYSSCFEIFQEATEINSTPIEQACKCNCNNSTDGSSLNLKQESSQNLKNNAADSCCTPDSDNLKDINCAVDSTTTVKSIEPKDCLKDNPALSRLVSQKQSKNSCKEPVRKFSKTTVHVKAQIRHSTTQTPSTNHNQGHLHRHHHAGRLTLGENGEGSDSGSSHEDVSSVTNSPTPRDSNRHCDCCYCEPAVAPTSRNYNEMRERLRQLLSKKKAKICKTTGNPQTKSSVEVSLSSSSLSSSSSTSSTITSTDPANLPNPALRSNTPVTNLNAAAKVTLKVVNSAKAAVPVAPVIPKIDTWSVDAALQFIEGSQSEQNEKKAAKKARQKQKKIEEKLQKQKEEVEKLKLIELQKKTPEVTITVVNPQKQNSQRAAPQPKLPEVSIIPAVMPKPQPALVNSKQMNSNKKKSVEIINANTNKNVGKNKSSAVSTTATVVATTPAIAESGKKKNAGTTKANQTTNTSQTTSSTSKKVTEIVPRINANDEFSDLTNLTKKERKKLRREMKKQEELKKEIEDKHAENQLQIVTIRRIMKPDNTEPTVTITLKGQTPAEDQVLYTIVDGETKAINEQSNQSQTTGKKKKNKGNNSANQQQNQQQQQQQQKQTVPKSQQSQNSNSATKTEQHQKNDSKNTKQQQSQQQTGKDKAKSIKQQEEQKLRQQQSVVTNETKTGKSKKDKKKNNNENKENLKQVTNENLQKQEGTTANKKTNKNQISVAPASSGQKQVQQQSSANSNNKNTKTAKNSNQLQNQDHKKANNNQNSQQKSGKSNNANSGNHNAVLSKVDNQKTSKDVKNSSNNKQKQNIESVQNQKREQIESSYSHYKEPNSAPATINIENLKLPPGITITKVDAPVKPLPLKSNSAPKPVNTTPKQTTIIAAPMSGVQSSNYESSQGTGNVIVVDTGRLKQDLMPKNSEKETSKDQTNQVSSSSKKKKKKKNKNTAAGNNDKSSAPSMQNNKSQQQPSGDYMNVEPARILHNPSTNMVTIRNPAFGPAPPKMEPCAQQAAIIKVGENGMVTIRSPALQQAINAGLQPPPKPDFIIKGGVASEPKPSSNNFMNGSELLSGPTKGSNGLQLPTDLAELRRRLVQQQPDNERTSSSTLFNNGLSNIQISKVTNGQSPNIPENGINLKGTSVTLTKIRNTEVHGNHQQQQHVEEPKGSTLSASSKNRKKKKRGNGGRQGGDDWNLVESVFNPKDIDLEDGEMDETERELEAFKRFCLQSVPPPRKEKVNLNLKDIVLKKKSSSSASTAAAASAAATAAAVVAAI